MRGLGLWSETAPSSDALSSTQPFAIDTLEFSEWLQFIFLPRMQSLLEAQSALPTDCMIAPVGEEYCRQNCSEKGAEVSHLISILSSIDQLLSGPE